MKNQFQTQSASSGPNSSGLRKDLVSLLNSTKSTMNHSEYSQSPQHSEPSLVTTPDPVKKLQFFAVVVMVVGVFGWLEYRGTTNLIDPDFKRDAIAVVEYLQTEEAWQENSDTDPFPDPYVSDTSDTLDTPAKQLLEEKTTSFPTAVVKNPVTDSTQARGWKRYTHSSSGLSLEYPPGLSFTEVIVNGEVSLQFAKNNVKFLQVGLYTEPNDIAIQSNLPKVNSVTVGNVTYDQKRVPNTDLNDTNLQYTFHYQTEDLLATFTPQDIEGDHEDIIIAILSSVEVQE